MFAVAEAFFGESDFCNTKLFFMVVTPVAFARLRTFDLLDVA